MFFSSFLCGFFSQMESKVRFGFCMVVEVAGVWKVDGLFRWVGEMDVQPSSSLVGHFLPQLKCAPIHCKENRRVTVHLFSTPLSSFVKYLVTMDIKTFSRAILQQVSFVYQMHVTNIIFCNQQTKEPCIMPRHLHHHHHIHRPRRPLLPDLRLHQ